MDTVVQVEALSKRYQIRHQSRARDVTFREAVSQSLRRAFTRTLGRKVQPTPNTEEFWALRDVSFKVQAGDRIGIIGRNGAGKSTLLKVLSRITQPTLGRVILRGRVASLLEVGTGFHPELSGRENIFLNGAVLGMSQAEIRKKFDAIVAFADVEKFLDTPVKRYSSGMYVRLAFAVAAHLEPEILIVDEVLAVGDSQFQKKCIGKMEEAGREGKTILFVSHNMLTVGAICNRGLVLRNGQVTFDGKAKAAIEHYLDVAQSGMSLDLSSRTDRSGDGRFRFTKAWVEGVRTDYRIGRKWRGCQTCCRV